MDNKIILHVGMPKTGTTFLQRALLRNSVWLEERGYVFPDLKSEIEMQMGEQLPQVLPVEVAGNGSIFHVFKNMNDSHNAQIINHLFEKLNNYLSEYNVIISSEWIWQENNTRDVVKLLSERFQNISVVVYLRRQDEYIESSWNQGVKEGTFSWTFTEYIQILHIYEEGNYLAKLENISEYISKENISVNIYEREKLKNNSIVDDFIFALGLKIDDKFKKEKNVFDSMYGNEAIRGEHLNCRLLVNKLCDSLTLRQKVWNIAVKILKLNENTNCQEIYFDELQRKAILDMFKSCNATISTEYIDSHDIFSNSINMDGKKLHNDYCVREDNLAIIMELVKYFDEKESRADTKEYIKKELRSLITQKQDILSKERELYDIYNSKSWKITRPLRAFDSLFHNICRK